MTDAPQVSEWTPIDPTLADVERECWYDAPMKAQVTDDYEVERVET